MKQRNGPGPVPPREAASVIFLKRPNLVYMTARPTTLRVAAGFYVFPGGQVDEADRRLAARDPAPFYVTGLEPGYAPFVAAAVRELFEEAGVLLAQDAHGRPLWEPAGAQAWANPLREARKALNDDRTDLAAVLAAYRWRVAADALAYVARWVTPPAARRRFDTRFFVVDGTDAIAPDPFPGEVAHDEWIALSETLRRDDAGTLRLMRPTRGLLQTLADIGDTEDIVAFYRDAGSPRLEVVERNTPEVLQEVLASQGIFVVPVPSPTLLPAVTTNVYVIVAADEALIVDAGDGGDGGIEQVMAAWDRAGRPRVQALVLTHEHRDHAGAAAALAARLQCSVAAHRLAGPALTERLGVTPNVVLDGGETFTLGRRRIDVVHSPGHAAGHVVLYEKETGVLFSGDNVVGGSSTWVGPPDGDMAVYLQSLTELKALNINVIAPGHGPLLDEGHRRIDELIERRLHREAKIARLVRERPRTVDDLFDLLYKGAIPPGVERMARRTIEGHLIKLEREGVVRTGGSRQGEPVYEAVSDDG